ncbi:MAG TPA: hypothetical protein ENK18_00250 [Deltaproteobacteria bacterium]|nr:hypothetical protein [Deltaproteobacteria bacterium]
MSDLTSAGGSLSIILLGLGGLGLVVMLGLAAIAFAKRRVPLTLLVAVPLLTCAVGAIGAWSNAGTALGEISAAAPQDIVSLATVGMYDALAADWFSRWVAAFLFGVGAWVAGLGAFFAGPEGRLTPIAAASSAGLTLLGAGVLAIYSIRYAIPSGTLLIGLLLFSGLGVAFSALRRAMYEHAHRVAGMRFASAMCMLLAISYGSRAMTQGNRMDTFGPGGLTSQADSLIQAISMWNDVAAPVITLAWLAFAFAILVAFAGFYYELGEVVERFTLVDVTLVLVMMAGLGLLRLVEDWRIDNLAAVATNAPAAELFAEVGTDLSSALVAVDKEFVGVHPVDGGFGDVLRYRKAEGDDLESWVRTHRWTGSSWDADDTPLDEVTDPSSLRPLLVMESSQDAAGLPELLSQLGGHALLLLRAEEVKSDVDVPPELAYLQVTYLPLTLAESRDLKTELWTAAGAKEVNWGPTTWYGDGMDEEPIEYLRLAFEDTGAPGLQILLGERARVKGVVYSCLPALVNKAAEAGDKPVPSGKWCQLSAGEEEEVRREVMELWDPPSPEHFRGRIGRPTDLAARAIGRGYIPDRIRREFGAIDYCLSVAIDEGEELAGPMQLKLRITRKGKIYGDLHEKSKNTNDMALRCVKDRLKKITFVVDEEIWPEPEPPAEGEEAPPEEPQTVDLVLDIRG